MPIQIDNMDSRVEILPASAGGSGSGGGSAGNAGPAAQDLVQLKEILRPLVMELIGEELESYMRTRG